MARFNHSLFSALMAAQWLAVFLLTPVYTAGAITEEKERRTLEFLLATDLSDREIILSKLLSRVATMLLLLLTGLPFLSFLQLMGGIDPNLLLAHFATAGVTVLSLASLSILVSVESNKTLNAVLGTYARAAFLLIVTFMPVLRWGNIFVVSEKFEKSGLGFDLIAYVFIHCGFSLCCIVVAMRKLRPNALDTSEMLPGIFHPTSLARKTANPTQASDVIDQYLENESFSWERPKVRHPVGDLPMRWKEIYHENASSSALLQFLKSSAQFVYLVLILASTNLFISFVTG